MQTYISILRGINVGGQRIIKMVDLKALYEDLGFSGVQTYIQSGNVVFRHDWTAQEEIEIKIEKEIFNRYGFDVPVVVLNQTEFRQIISGNPLATEANCDPSHLHVTFLSNIPDPGKWEKICTGNYGTDEFILADKAIYLCCRNGYGKTKLTNGFFEQKLGIAATTRNWRTTLELLQIAERISSHA